MNRVIRKSTAQSAGEVLDLLGALFSAELVSSSRCLWLVSPWISDVDIIDNSAGTYPALTRHGRRRIRLAEILVTLAAEGTRVVVATTSDGHNDTFRRRLTLLAGDLRVGEKINVVVDTTRSLHTKALTGDDYALVGSMNITHNGIHLREEYVELRTEPDFVAQARMDAFDRYGGVL
ncbi:phosphatidylserine/phosphatidylglycerophosphate/cardiolipin synthase family protein [Planosporangium thailandense]|uniref:Phosphatidylserine/phosphatidylglycerophosphate/ cardiolipin synthase family protein n=1 Tax=Planosporangium thailandense TaxID=765197 RepID=A0ABX0XXT0_9ACTN|nr:phosphatidylserine/phosphatidylglycerophosphate/cardiolipin synthase family protein [Planosporangium thailandense]